MNKRERVLLKTKYKCGYCGTVLFPDNHIDHILPKSKGGTDHIDNLMPSCPGCNMKKYDRTPEQFKSRLVNDARSMIDAVSDELRQLTCMLSLEKAEPIWQALYELNTLPLHESDVTFYMEQLDSEQVEG